MDRVHTTMKRLMVSTDEAAVMLDVSRETVRRWIRGGQLPAAKLSASVVRIRVADIEAFIKARTL